jgi:SPP1 family phage portal protein
MIEELTDKVIQRLVENHRSQEFPRLKKLENYYNANNEINRRLMKDPSKPNNKIANAYASYITDTLTGYFIGEPISYTSADETLLQDLTMIFEYNDEADENAELAKNASIYGVAYEMLYLSEEDKMIRFKALDPKTVIPIFDKTVEENLIAVIRYYDDYDVVEDKTYTIIEVIDNAYVRRYKLGTSLTLLDEYQHYFSLVPVAIFKNNEEQSGDFENVISLIDAYDKMESDSLNDFEYFVDAYLALYGFTADGDDVAQMKENRVLLMDEGTSAEWLIKQTSDVYVENMKNRLDNDIHKFAKCPNMSDENFASNASGVAIKFKLLGTENLVAIKERKFKRGIQQRLELMSAINSILREGFDWRAIDIIFTRNIPSNDVDIANMVNSLKDLVSEETLLAQIPFVEDVQDELERLKKEREENKELNPFFSVGLDYNTEAMNKDKEEDEPVE